MKKLLFVLLLSLFLVACGNESDSNTDSDEPDQKEQKESQEVTDDTSEESGKEEKAELEEVNAEENEEYGEWETVSFGELRMDGVGYKEELGMYKDVTPIQIGAVELYVVGAFLASVKSEDEDFKSLVLNGKDESRAITATFNVLNTSDEPVSFTENEITVSVQPGVQLIADQFITEGIESDLDPGEEGTITAWFIINDSDKNIDSFSININAPQLMTWEDMADDQIQLDVLSVKEAEELDLF